MSDISVIHFANTFISRPGNIGVRTGQLVEQLSKRGIRFRTVARGTAPSAPASDYLTMGWLGHLPRLLNGIRNRLLPTYNHRFLDIALFDGFARFHLDRALDGLDRPVAHVWDTCPKLIRALRARGVPIVLDIPIAPASYSQRMARSGRAPFMLDDSRFVALEHEAHQLADILLAPSAFVRDELLHAGLPADRINVVPFGAPSAPGDTTAPRHPEAQRPLRFCFVGAVSRRKGLAELLAAWAEPELARHELHLCGRISKEGQALLAQSPRPHVITPGFVDAGRYLDTCDVFVLPSWMEGSSKAVYEAMQAGLPCVVTHSTGSVVRHGVDGFVIDAGDVDSLRRSLLWFVQHPQEARAMGESARQQAATYSVTRYATAVAATYSSLAERQCSK